MSQNPILLDGIAVRYKCLPHQLLDINLEDLQIDYICAEMGAMAEIKAIRKLRRKYGKKV